ncbi:hypothetical protein C7967_11555 [Thalassospira sp. 11-3]|nr:hypothetical protein C7967_11555 [Thalassospira sp. 11-3]
MSVSITIYIESKPTLLAKIQAIEALIDSMFLRMAEVAGGLGSTVDEYSMDDGQMKVRTSYRNVDDVSQGIKALEALKQQYINRYNGRVVNLRDARGLR